MDQCAQSLFFLLGNAHQNHVSDVPKLAFENNLIHVFVLRSLNFGGLTLAIWRAINFRESSYQESTSEQIFYIL